MTIDPELNSENAEIITDLKGKLAKAEKIVEQLTQQNNVLTNLIISVPLEFRTPLMVIRTYAKLLLKEATKEEQSLSEFQTEAITNISNNSDELEQMIILLMKQYREQKK
ncbi:MAG: hypothetical protein GY943_05110 [Chloroflexi bacterium]|nr:hypothetical protein [Chloroflexota bacterium]